LSIDKFVTEIQNRKKNDLAELDKKLSDKKSETDAKKNSSVKEFRRTILTRQKQKQKEKEPE